jgi:ketosteroid isomerase-like protein
MSDENEQVYLQADETFNRGDLDRWIEFMDPEVEWHDLPTLPGAAVHCGREGVLQRIRELQEAMPDFRTVVEGIESVEDRVVARVRYLGSGGTSGAPVEIVVSQVAEFRDGRVLRSRLFTEHAEALEAARE